MSSTIKLTQEDQIPLATDMGALGNRINKQTKTIHNKIDKVVSLRLIYALREPKVYRQGLQSFYHVFQTIESQYEYVQKHKDQYDERIINILGAIWKPAFGRTVRVEKDLLFFYGNEAKFKTPIMKEQIDFVNHIKQVTTENPLLLLAYFHVMYLALFAGGRIMRSSIAQSIGLFPQVKGKTSEEVALEATNFFRFDVEDENSLRYSFKKDYEINTRNELSEKEKELIIAEAQIIFERNVLCVQELELHNRQLLTQKLSYKVIKSSRLVLLGIIILCLIYYLNKYAGSILSIASL